jgi:hypothetical protein
VQIWSFLGLPIECKTWDNEGIIRLWANNSREKLVAFAIGLRLTPEEEKHGRWARRSARNRSGFEFRDLDSELFRLVGKAFWGTM